MFVYLICMSLFQTKVASGIKKKCVRNWKVNNATNLKRYCFQGKLSSVIKKNIYMNNNEVAEYLRNKRIGEIEYYQNKINEQKKTLQPKKCI